jgi:Zn-dependent protease
MRAPRSIRLTSALGIDLFLHWSWFLVAGYEITDRRKAYSSITWNVLEYLALFLIVTLHEYGHALACRQVGGVANKIVLWPLGGVAYVNPPHRPGATLWSIVAGPLVNVALLPILWILVLFGKSMGWMYTLHSAYSLIRTIWSINLALLIFNMLPIYPMDGGKILWSLLWYPMGRARGLLVATIVGLLGAIGLIGVAFWAHSIWLGILCAFFLLNCWSGLRGALALSRSKHSPRHDGFVCPSCSLSPSIGTYWTCPQCKKRFDTFATGAVCPSCRTNFASTACLECGRSNPIGQWIAAAEMRPHLSPPQMPPPEPAH